MSDSFGYADDFKIVGTNPVAINIDIRRIWKWCQSNLMEINLSKTKCLWLKGVGTVRLPNFSFGSTSVMKDLGVVVADTLTWATHSQSRTQKALNALYSIKRNLSLANYANRKNSYVSYVVPIISYGSSVWKPGKVELSQIESVQKKAAKWITGAKIPYKEQLLKLNLLPLSLYHELHVVLLFAKILTGKVDINWKLHVSITEPGTTRYQTTCNFICRQPKLKNSGNVNPIIGTEPATLRTPLMSSSNTISYFMKTTKPNFSICILSTSDCVTMKTTRALGELCVGATTA